MKRLHRTAWLFTLLSAACCLSVSPTQAKDAPAHSAVTPMSRPDAWWMERHNAMNSRVKQGNVDLLMIGDSITQGWEGPGKKAWDEHFAKRSAVNLGIGGDQTGHVLWRLDNGNIDGLQPKLAVLMIGTNNSHSNTSQQIADGVKAIVEKLRAKLPETKILVLAIFPRGADENDHLRKVNDGANKEISKLADDKMVFFMDIGPKFLAEDGKTLKREVMPDLLHLNEKSYQTWAEAIEPKVKELMGS